MFEYCEQSSGLISQFTNVISNLAFIAVSLALYLKTRKLDLTLAPLFIFASSTVWHFSEDPRALSFDKAVVASVILYLIWTLMRPFFMSPYHRVGAVFALFSLSIAVGVLWPLDDLWTSLFLVPLLALIMLARHCKAERSLFLSAALFLFLACCFRTLDLPLCEEIPWGTHSLWHLGTAISLYFIACAINQQRLDPVR